VVEPPEEEPPFVIVPDGPPVVEVNRGRLKVKLAIPITQRPLRSRRLMTLASCSRSCSAKLNGRLGAVSKGSSAFRIAGVSRALSAGIQTRVKLKISRKALRATKRTLRRGKAVRGRVVIVAVDRSGRRAKAVQRIRLVPVRKG
jgi:hypothetical protein